MAETAEVLGEETDLKLEAPFLDGLLPALRRLDGLLERAVAAAQTAYGPKAATDLYRGLYISQAEVEQLLLREPGVPIFQGDGQETVDCLPDPTGGDFSRLAWLQQAFDLSLFDLDLILIALAPELDLRYERLYAYLQDHVSRRRPSVDLALNLLCSSAAVKLARRVHFAPEAPLIRHGLLHLIPDSDQGLSSLLSHYLKLDDQIVRLLLGQTSLDSRLASFCCRTEPNVSLDRWLLATEEQRALVRLVLEARETQQPLRLYFHGPGGADQRQTAEMLAGEAGVTLLAANLERAPVPSADFEQSLRLLFREGWFQDALLYLDQLDELRGGDRDAAYQYLLDQLTDAPGITILAGSQPWVAPSRRPAGVITIPFAIPDVEQRRVLWQVNLAEWDVALAPADLDRLANCFRLTPTQIAETALTAYNQARRQAAMPTSGPLIAPDLFAAARAQSGHDLTALAHKIEPVYTWSDIVLPDDALAQLREICQRVTRRQHVLGEWGFGRKLSLGKGVNALFAGPSGTGKTMAAEIIANELGLDLYKIDLSVVVSKYIGETEKNLDRIFRAAENANAILFFDEADALFGKRSEVRDSHDRYANIEISYLLQKMEQFEGITILATNLRGNLDEAFMRRLAFTVHFPFPGEADRRRIWAGIWPVQTPLAGDVDLDFLARQFKLSGGNIKNIALAAAFLAAGEDGASPNASNGHGGVVSMAHLRHATRREYQKLGKQLSADELGLFTQELSA